MKNNMVVKAINIILYLLFIGGAIVLFFIPEIFDYFELDKHVFFDDHFVLYKMGVYCCYLFCLLIIFILARLFGAIYSENPFSYKVVNYLNSIAILFMIVSFIVIIKITFIPTIISAAIAMVTFIISLCFFTISGIFKNVVSQQQLEYVREYDSN